MKSNLLRRLSIGIFLLLSQSAHSGTLADAPLSLKAAVPPNVVFALSVEFPTANTAAYQDSSGYSAGTNDPDYLGYFDPGKCYSYDTGNGWFYPVAAATNRACSGTSYWSGNFLNWATMTGLDEFRYAMSGGNRSTDDSALTVLERSYQSGQGGQGGKTNFPDKTASFASAGVIPYPTSISVKFENAGRGVQVRITPATPTGVVTCSWNGTAFSCTLTLGSNTQNLTCPDRTGDGSNSQPFACTSFSTFGSVTPSITSTSTKSGSGSNHYMSKYNVIFGTDYNVRVKVCDSSVGLESNCKQFGSSWKPTGVIQDNGDTMRFGVTSYYQSEDVDNAVLRSKAKYVAPQRYSASGVAVANPYMEWNAANGVLYRNPDNCDSAVSGCAPDSATVSSAIGAMADTGVINYINKFGRTSHTYKTYDDVGKLYYETLKYLRHESPTADFYQGATAANADSFPVITTWDDPILYACQKNYIIMMGDSHTWCDKRLPGGTFASAVNDVCKAPASASGGRAVADDMGSLGGDSGVNVTTETDKVGVWEGMSNLSTTSAVGAYGASYYMAGLAAWAARSDIRSKSGDFVGTQTVKTFVIDVEENKDCGYQSQYWLAAKYGNPGSYNSAGEWLTTANPWSQNLTLPSGTCSSRPPSSTAWPKNLLRAGDPKSMIASVRSAIESINGEVGDEAALAQSSGNLDSGTSAYVYRATYNSAGWSGDVQALVIDQNGAVSPVPVWSAAAKLPAASARKIFSFNDSRRTGVAFDPDAFSTNLSADQQTLLNADQFGIADERGGDRMRYLRGDPSKEANQSGTNYGWRSRINKVDPASLGDVVNRLGDIINSSPVYVGRPQAGYSDASYKSFASTYASRLPVVYVGGNDGMLHGYDASYTNDTSGTPQVTTHSATEIVGYVPASLYGKLSQLMSPNYSHKYFVDGSPVVADACVGDCAGAGDWKTLLVGTLNAGGQGVFALDVSDPADASGSSRFSADKVLWEFSDQDDAELGYTFSRPIVRKLNDGKWYVIFGNGFNNTQADAHASENGRAYLFLLPVGGPGSGNAWVRDTNYYRIALKSPSEGVSPTLPLNPPNGLASVAGVDKNLDGKTDYVYAGDRNGNLWKVDLTSATPSGWTAAFGSSDSPLPLFTTSDGAGSAQPIATGIEVVRHPQGGFLVMFGTGTWIDTADPFDKSHTQSLYGIWDKDDGTTTVSGRGVLQQQKVLAGVDSSGNACTIGSADCYLVYSNCQPNYSEEKVASNLSAPLCPESIAYKDSLQQLGWFIDLPLSGERTRSLFPVISGKNVRFTTLTPATDPCTGNTLGLEHNLSYLTGGSPEQPLFVFSSTTTGFITVLSSVLGSSGAGVKVVLGGRLIQGGAADQPVNFSARPPASVVPAMANLPSPPTSACIGSACGAGYIPGWGFLMNLGAAAQYALSCHPPQFGAKEPICTWEYKSAKFGRLNWKQILH